jgi:hypothetical protein
VGSETARFIAASAPTRPIIVAMSIGTPRG